MIIYEEILRDFQRQKVKYVIVGGIAFNLLGGSRNTFDLDILVEMTDKNLSKLVKILKDKGYKVKQPVDPMLIADKNIRNDWINNKHMKAFNFYKGEDTYQEVDIIIDSPVSYEQAKEDIKKVKVRELKLPIISAEKLIKMKKVSGRNKDMDDIKNLRMIRKLE